MTSSKEPDGFTENPGPRIFGRNIAEIPCFKYSYIYGITGGIIGGLGYFMFTSRVKAASHFGMTSFVITTLSYWVYCRHEWSLNQQNVLLYQELLNSRFEKKREDALKAKEPTGPVAV